MSINNLKGTIYDFLGYFAPGLVGIICASITILRHQNTPNLCEKLNDIINNISGLEIAILVIVAYILGHAIASGSSWLIEKKLMEKMDSTKKSLDTGYILGKEHYEIFCLKYKDRFNTMYTPKDIRKVICYIQSNQSVVYETAMIFLSFYGMARNLSFVCGIFFITEIIFIIKNLGNSFILIIYGLLFLIFLYEYIRFRRYFLDTIFSSFLIPDSNK